MCWSFDHQQGFSKLFVNGKLAGSFTFDTWKSFPGSKNIFSSSFIIGQDPDPPTLKGGFEKEQVFIGDITELNVWNYSLNDNVINKMGDCKTFEKGNVISWLKEKFTVNNAKYGVLKEFEDLCESKNKTLVFTTKQSWVEAWSLCYAHGGIIFTPQNREQLLVECYEAS